MGSHAVELILRVRATALAQGAALTPPQYVVRHPARGTVVIDTAFPAEAEDTSKYPGAPLSWLLDVRVDAEQDPVDKQVDAADVAFVLATHLHHDHAGNMAPFAAEGSKTRFLLHGEERRTAKGVLGGFRDDILASSMPEERISEFEFDPAFCSELVSDWPGLSRDLFGDGSVIALATPGHTGGHTSYLVNTEYGPVFIAGDVAWLGENIWYNERKILPLHFFLEKSPAAQDRSLTAVHEYFKVHDGEILFLAAHDFAQDAVPAGVRWGQRQERERQAL